MDSLGNRYRLEHVIGEGAVATVYQAYDGLTERPVAIKVLKDVHDETDTARLWVELRSLQRIKHPSIIRTIDLGRSARGMHYIVMELLQGQTLRSRMMAVGRMELRETVTILQQVFEALDACHFSGIIHRDVKPENVFLQEQHGRPIKLIDFGMAKILHDLSPPVSNDSFIFGTPSYMAPERIKGLDPTPASDIYSAGVMAFEMLAGTRPFPGDSPEAIMRKQLREALPRFSDLDPPVSVPRELRDVIRECLRKDALQRPRAAGLASALQQLLDSDLV